jgi:oligoendopeptidase F
MPAIPTHVVPVHAATTARSADSELGDLPGWNLDDLYPGPQSAEFTSDLSKARRDAAEFEARWKGGLDSGRARSRQMTGWALRLKLMSASRS